MKLTTRRTITTACVVLLVTACGSSSSESKTTAAPTSSTTAATTIAPASSTTVAVDASSSPMGSETAPFHAIPDEPVVVTGQAACSFSNDGVDPEGGAGLLVMCEHDMSDPRVSGTEVHDRFRITNGGETGDVWVAEEATITNAEGTWRGIAQAADDGLPCGEAHYVGEGAYEGLEYHYYFGHFADEEDDWVVIRGWIYASG